MLAGEQHLAWERDGFLVLEDLVSHHACDELVARGAELAEAYIDDSHSVFTTDEQQRHADNKFLSSGATIDFFWETEALGPDGRPNRPQNEAFNKMGHAAHDLDPVFSRFSRQEPLGALAVDLGLPDPRLLQSMLIFKHAGIGGEVASHQDATFLWTDPAPGVPRVVGLWFALEDATIDNGCLFAQPGGHRSPVRRLFRRARDGGTEFVELDDTPLPELGDPSLVPLEVPKGTVVALHGALPHGSHANRSGRSRQAYTLHLIDADASYPTDNWLQRPLLPLRGF